MKKTLRGTGAGGGKKGQKEFLQSFPCLFCKFHMTGSKMGDHGLPRISGIKFIR